MNIGTMYLIQRKVDGLYYKNGVGKYGSSNWSDKVSDCRPFKTVGGAKTSGGWNSWKTVLTDDACDACKTARYDNWNHNFSERYNNSRWTKTKKNITMWIEKNGRKPCSITSRRSDAENPNKIITVTLSID